MTSETKKRAHFRAWSAVKWDAGFGIGMVIARRGVALIVRPWLVKVERGPYGSMLLGVLVGTGRHLHIAALLDGVCEPRCKRCPAEARETGADLMCPGCDQRAADCVRGIDWGEFSDGDEGVCRSCGLDVCVVELRDGWALRGRLQADDAEVSHGR